MKRQKQLPPYSADEIAADPDLAAALVRDAEPLLAIERQIKVLREQKADLFDDLRCSRFKPEYAKAWVATQMPDEEKDAVRAEKAIELARVVAAMDGVKASQARARAGVRPRGAMPAPRQEEIDQETGEVLGDAPAPAAETSSHGSPELNEDAAKLEAMGQDPGPTLEDLTLADDEAMAGSGNFSPEAAAETNRITRAIAEQFGRGAETTRATSSPEAASTRTPLRTLPPRTPEPAPDWPEMPAGLDRSRQAEIGEAAE